METVIALVVIGAILLILETILPGLIAGILGIFCLVGAVVLGYTYFGFRTGSWILLSVACGLIIGTLAWLKFFPDSRVAKLFVSQRTIAGVADTSGMLHRTGLASSDLRPSGTAQIDGKRIDVVAESGMIPRGVAIKVVAVDGMKVVVRAI